MLVGYNTNISYKGTVYHVQTEDSGLKNPMVITLLYVKGTILSSKKSSYAHLADMPDYKDSVRELMKEQHKAMIKELIAGKHTADIIAPEPVAAQPAAPPEVQDVASGGEPAQTAETPTGPDTEKKADTPPQSSADDDAKSQISRSLDDILLDYIMKGDQ